MLLHGKSTLKYFPQRKIKVLFETFPPVFYRQLIKLKLELNFLNEFHSMIIVCLLKTHSMHRYSFRIINFRMEKYLCLICNVLN